MSMNFLNKAKETANKINNDSSQSQKPVLPGVKPNIPGKPPVAAPGKPPVGGPGKPPTMPGKPPAMPGKIPVAPPKAVQTPVQKPVVKDEDIQIEAANGVSPLKVNNPFKPKATTGAVVANEEKESLTANTVEETKVKDPHVTAQAAVNKVEADAAKVGETQEIKVEEIKTPVAKKSGNSRKKATSAKATEATIVSDADAQVVDGCLMIPKTQLSFEDALNVIKSGFVDEAWETFRTDNVTRLNEIVISNDMTTQMIKSTLSELSLMKDSIWLIFNDTKTMYENLTAKEPEGIIERVKKVSSKGANPEERKLNATLAVMNYKDENNNIVNLYELLDEMRERFNFTKSLMDGIAYKNSVLITMLGSLKLEK